MPQYKISGVWKNSNGAITHYAFHTQTDSAHTRANKVSKVDAIALLERGNTAVTWVWNYAQAIWNDGEPVVVVNGSNGKYLRSNKDKQITDNLGHLIDYD